MRKLLITALLCLMLSAVAAQERLSYPSTSARVFFSAGSDLFEFPSASGGSESVPELNLMNWELGMDGSFMLGITLNESRNLHLLAGPGMTLGLSRFRSEVIGETLDEMEGVVEKVNWLNSNIIHAGGFFRIALGTNKQSEGYKPGGFWVNSRLRQYNQYYFQAGSSLYKSLSQSDKQIIVPSFALGVFNQPVETENPLGSGIGIQLGLDWFSFPVEDSDFSGDASGSYKSDYIKRAPVFTLSIFFGGYTRFMSTTN